MSGRGWFINVDETAHQISFTKKLGDNNKPKLIRSQFALSPDMQNGFTSVMFTLTGSKEDISQSTVIQIKAEVFEILDEINAKCGQRSRVE